MKEQANLEENKTKPIGKQVINTPAQGARVEQRIAHMEAMQQFQLMAKKRSRPFWKKMLSIK
ncbi:hypothetical protein GXP67_09425 [Rhodocytophaga rosea]|uniref:Uncharacterized protein n=1 Tax=Rhodocytophaga rosea TaxID=2704465 RepID=A0A6C0GGK1_9BACT|nr:hypothetical protein [Rhodocytophaga rosea]QHT66862.1 hypothetical protein GXP67_09425 [Rhodocytophaga rosea]